MLFTYIVYAYVLLTYLKMNVALYCLYRAKGTNSMNVCFLLIAIQKGEQNSLQKKRTLYIHIE